MLSATRSLLRTAAAPSSRLGSFAAVGRPTSQILRSSPYSTAPPPEESTQEPAAATEAPDAAKPSAGDAATTEMQAKLDQQSKTIAELKDARLRTLADFENLQKISTREKAQAKDFALTSFAKDLVQSIDILHLALKSITPEKLSSSEHANGDLKGLHEGVSLTKREIEKCLERHGVKSFDPTGEQFDPNRHEALYQAPVPGKEPGSVLECQEIGYTIKDRLLRPAKVGVVLSQE
ncbi:mitochondrial nucleotide exchange factor MGE1 [Sporobolomyces salmoneus]|uniref:mitochondrial nucleotide exchange factor MGE1 n=1 Tax=Sporobolomyces salmoneus TaxID=183962 RepID=UPI00317BF760